MSEPGWAEWLGEHRAEETASERAWRLAGQAERRDDRAAELEEAERAEALQERRELQEMAALTLGVAGRSASDVFADASRVGDEDAQYAEAQKVIERIDRRRARRQQEMVERAQLLGEVTGLASRSASTVTGAPDLLAEAKTAHRELMQAARSMDRAASRGAGRPKEVSRSRGVAIRSEHCHWCTQEGLDDETAFLLHSDPERPLPVTTPGQAKQAEEAERRRTGRSYPEISR